MKLSSNCFVELEKQAKRDLAKVPNYIKDKLLLWVDDINV